MSDIVVEDPVVDDGAERWQAGVGERGRAGSGAGRASYGLSTIRILLGVKPTTTGRS